MGVRWAVAAIAMIAFAGGAEAASSWYWCEPLQAYYPWVRSCPGPWRQVDPKSAQQPQPSPQATSPQANGAMPVQSGAQNDAPTFASPDATAHGDGLDAWCQGDVSAMSVAICGDGDLRALAAQRLKALDEAVTRIPADQQKVLAADQNGWAMSSTQSCGVRPETRPTLPLPPSVKECLLHVGQARLAYLRSYGTPAANSQQAATNPTAPAPSAAAANPPTPATTPNAPQPQTAAPSPAPSQPASPSAASAPPANAPAAGTASQTEPALAPEPPAKPATSSCNSTFLPISHNPFMASRAPSLDTLQGKAMALVALLSLATVLLWVVAMLQRVRGRIGWPG
jgi:hypothetical protein